MEILRIIICPQALGAVLIVSNHVIFRARAPHMVSRLGRLRQLSNGFGVFPLSRPARPKYKTCQETSRLLTPESTPLPLHSSE